MHAHTLSDRLLHVHMHTSFLIRLYIFTIYDVFSNDCYADGCMCIHFDVVEPKHARVSSDDSSKRRTKRWKKS